MLNDFSHSIAENSPIHSAPITSQTTKLAGRSKYKTLLEYDSIIDEVCCMFLFSLMTLKVLYPQT